MLGNWPPIDYLSVDPMATRSRVMLELHRSRAVAVTAVALLALAAPAARAADAGAEVTLQALALVGVPYRYGSDDPARGLDCSGLVRHVFRAVAALELPRRSEEISRFGRSVARSELQPGDLVFFDTRGRPYSHVAVYVGDGRFVHAPARRGRVRVEAIGDRYWLHRFNGARRVLPAPAPIGQIGPRADDLASGP
jgi:cell wall-associated NlpC family hydrolase